MEVLRVNNPIDVVLLGCALFVSYFIGVAFYNVFLHPLRAYPGPLLWRMSQWPRARKLIEGNLPFYMQELFAKYGPIVRIAPNELAYCEPDAWKDIYGHRHNGEAELPKWDGLYRVVDNVPRSIINSRRDEHSMLRRQLAHGFSERSMQAQEPVIGTYVDLLVQRLNERCNGGLAALNMREWLNWTTFDVIGELGFGSSFGCLDNSDYHPWVKIVTQSTKQTAVLSALSRSGFRFLIRIALKMGRMAVKDNQALMRNKMSQRMELGTERPDLVEGFIRKNKEGAMSFMQVSVNAGVLIVAGSETTATLLSGAIYLLTMNPDKLQKMTEEVRSRFNSNEEITLSSINDLSYMLACLNETLRCYPPVPGGLPREVPKGGAFISGRYVPEGTAVAVWQYAINHDPRFWKDPESFLPERFMGDPKFAGDQLDAMQPFSVGPRNCIGRNLAYAEMRLIMAKIVYNFDMKIENSSRGWLKANKAYNLWHKPGLFVNMTPVGKSG
ncbi:cytochrome P450 ClCP1 [Hypoxylon sp. FL1284]|nr:cytochrome P450 ClCP1 [Hypoxylon sp. FL1284]